MARKAKRNLTPQVNKDLNGFDIHINEFGEIISTMDISKLNNFLDDNVEDKKFKGVPVIKRNDDSMELEEVETLDKKQE
jgi:hypothetical protein